MIEQYDQMQLREEMIASILLKLYSPLMKEDSLGPQVKSLEAGTDEVMEECWLLIYYSWFS